MAAANTLGQAAKLAAKYGPHAVAAAKVAGPAAKEFAATQQQRLTNRRHAFDKAATVVDGSVLRVRHRDDPVWVVYAGDEPIETYPQVEGTLAELTRNVDLSARVTPAEREERRVRRRAGAAAQRARVTVRRKGKREGASPGAIGASGGQSLEGGADA